MLTVKRVLSHLQPEIVGAATIVATSIKSYHTYELNGSELSLPSEIGMNT